MDSRVIRWAATPEDSAPVAVSTQLCQVPLELVREFRRLTQRQEVPARNHIGRDTQSFLGDLALERNGKEAVVETGDNPDRDVGPALERRRLLKRPARLAGSPRATRAAVTSSGTS